MNQIAVSPEVAGIVRPGWLVAEKVVVLDRDPRMDEPLRQAAAAMRAATETETETEIEAESARLAAAVRTMYKRVGIDPTKTRPSSEALLRRVRKGDDLPRINSLVDISNWCSLESQLPFGLYDADAIRGAVTLRLGLAGEEYAGIRKDTVHVAGRLALVDDLGPFGNPTSDSRRTMVTTGTVRALVVIFAPVSVPAATVDRVLATTKERIERFCV